MREKIAEFAACAALGVFIASVLFIRDPRSWPILAVSGAYLLIVCYASDRRARRRRRDGRKER